MISLTTIVGVDDRHLAELKLVWPTWKRHRPEILRHKLLLMCDANRTREEWGRALRFVDHPDKELVLWDLPNVDQREKMLSSLVYGAARHVKTAWYLKLDTDAVAVEPGPWLQPAWFEPALDGRLPVFITSPWRYTKPPDAIDRLDHWAESVPELRSYPPLEIHPKPGWSRVSHPRIISWCFFGNTAWTREIAAYCEERLPVPSQDTFLWYCAARRGDFFRRIRMASFGWRHIGCRGRLRAASATALHVRNTPPVRISSPPVSTTTSPSSSVPPLNLRSNVTNTEPKVESEPAKPRNSGLRRYARHARSLIELIAAMGAKKKLRGAEIGVAQGATSRTLLERFPNLHLYMVDSWATCDEADPYYLSGDLCARLTPEEQNFRALEAEHATQFAAGRRTIVRWDSKAAAQQIGEDPLDFVFIDADHTFEGVKADIEAWWPLIRPGGVMVGHDYGGVRNRLGLFGVSAAVDEFAQRSGFSVKRSPGLVWSIQKPGISSIGPATSRVPLVQSSPSINRGVVYLLTGAAHADRLIVSLWSLRKHYKGPVTVYTTQPESHEIGRLCAADRRLDIEHRTAVQSPIRKNSSFITKIEILPHVPYETSLYLDCDTLVAGDPAEMFELSAEQPVGLTRFSQWLTSGRIMRRRLEVWRKLRMPRRKRAYVDALVTEGLKSYPAINGGVVSVRRGADILPAWHELSLLGRRSFICDEIAMQLLLPQYPHKLLDCRFNCSPIHARDTKDVRIWHFHGEKHLRRPEGRALWLPVYKECLRHRVARVDEWARTTPQVAALNLTV